VSARREELRGPQLVRYGVMNGRSAIVLFPFSDIASISGTAIERRNGSIVSSWE